MLRIGAVDDPLEREADRMAEHAASGALGAVSGGPTLQRACACGGQAGPDGECAACKQKRLQRAAAGPAGTFAPPIVHEALRAAGRPLDGATRTAMESRFGHDFGFIR